MPSELNPAALHRDWLQPDWQLPAAWPRIRAFMTTRAGGCSEGLFASMNVGAAVGDEPARVQANRSQVAEALGAPLVFLKQVHGAEVQRLSSDLLAASAPPVADASVAATPGLGCAIQVADCLPVLFAAPGAVAGAHAGWRGLAGGVLENTVAALCAAAGCAPGELRAWLGPCIGPQQFEVGAEVLAAFGRSAAQPGPEFVYRANAAGEARWLADLPALARLRLRAAGLSHFSGGHWCTLSEPSRFFSYRHDARTGRMVAVIGLV
ncbi:peptidoglycan editing factor PgeF [Paucibacter sp. DJ1R-11]|uniref:peptidoglycan editing factor PgeF n=1 Tax=Paucibacter sp. DJ1R-11 TaxID=2893556 RepID=UPI00398C2570